MVTAAGATAAEATAFGGTATAVRRGAAADFNIAALSFDLGRTFGAAAAAVSAAAPAAEAARCGLRRGAAEEAGTANEVEFGVAAVVAGTGVSAGVVMRPPVGVDVAAFVLVVDWDFEVIVSSSDANKSSIFSDGDVEGTAAAAAAAIAEEAAACFKLPLCDVTSGVTEADTESVVIE